MNIQTISPFSTAVSISDDEFVDLLADEISEDYVERMFASAAEELDVMNGNDLQSLSSDAIGSGPGADLVEALAEDAAERSVEDSIDKVVDARFTAPPSSISAMSLQAADQFELMGIWGKIHNGIRRVGRGVRKALKGPLKRVLKEAGKIAIPAIIGLLQASVPQGIAPQGLFSRARKWGSALIKKGKKKIKSVIRSKARDFVRHALGEIDGFLQDRISRFSADLAGAAPTAPVQDDEDDDGFFWEEEDGGATPFSVTVPMSRPSSGQVTPLFI